VTTRPFDGILDHLRRAAMRQDRAGTTDAELLGRYARTRDEAAFEALVRRHGPMVLGVCRRVLANEADAEDAFQATFLVLVRKAGSVRPGGLVGSWLYGVARTTALKARAMNGRRRLKEREAASRPRLERPPEAWEELQGFLDAALARLPEKYRVPVVLCELEGRPIKEAARQLGWPQGTVASRLARARGLLAKQLTRDGVALSGAALGAAFGRAAAPAGGLGSLVATTARAASYFATGGGPGPGSSSAKVATLTEGVLKSMLLTRLKCAIAVVLVIGAATLGAGALLSRGRATEPPGAPADGQQRGQENRDDLHERVAELKQQLRRIEMEIARLEQETSPRHEERTPRDGFLADRFKYRIPFETGAEETKEGGRIEIQEVWGTRPRIEVGGQYLVRGRYVLPPGERGTLYFYETAEGAWGQTPTATMDLQYTNLDKEKGEFTLMHGMAGPGYFHLYLASPERYSRYFANVYFGTGDNVLRKKSW
jgi:RNA polymerase sigma factor (sigma-70 family)